MVMQNHDVHSDHGNEGGCNINIYCGGCGKKHGGENHNHHPKPCDPEFAEVYSSITQNLSASPGALQKGQVVTLENTIVSTAGIDVSQAATTGKIFINTAGWYDVATGLCGSLNPIASPLPVWTLSLFVNGVYLPGSTFANMTLSPEQKANEIVADVYAYFNKGDYVQLANTSNAAVVLNAPSLGTNTPTNSAYLKLVLLRAGAK